MCKPDFEFEDYRIMYVALTYAIEDGYIKETEYVEKLMKTLQEYVNG
jgi:hypothetical protein